MQVEEPEGDVIETAVVTEPSSVIAPDSPDGLEQPSTAQAKVKEQGDEVKVEDNDVSLATATADEDDEARIPFPKQTLDTPNEDVNVELSPRGPSSPTQPSPMRYSARSRKSSSSASILSIRARPGGETMFKPGTPTTAVSPVIVKSAAGTRDSAGTTPGSPLPRTEELDMEDDYFSKHRRSSTGSAGCTPREDERDEVEIRSDKDALLMRPTYGTASQSLRDIHKAK
jgi:hypothetical protein